MLEQRLRAVVKRIALLEQDDLDGIKRDEAFDQLRQIQEELNMRRV